MRRAFWKQEQLIQSHGQRTDLRNGKKADVAETERLEEEQEEMKLEAKQDPGHVGLCKDTNEKSLKEVSLESERWAMRPFRRSPSHCMKEG